MSGVEVPLAQRRTTQRRLSRPPIYRRWSGPRGTITPGTELWLEREDEEEGGIKTLGIEKDAMEEELPLLCSATYTKSRSHIRVAK